jgi:hypothetical protein
MKNFYSFVLFFSLSLINGYIFQFLSNNIFHIKNNATEDFSQFEKIIIIIIAPILETLFFSIFYI